MVKVHNIHAENIYIYIYIYILYTHTHFHTRNHTNDQYVVILISYYQTFIKINTELTTPRAKDNHIKSLVRIISDVK